MAHAQKGRVCVTGAGGFIGSSLVKLLLSKGYIVHGTVRQPSDKKYAHLWTFDHAKENLKLFKADVLDYNSIWTAVEGCRGVFHVASPVPSSAFQNREELIEMAVKGTLNVLKASSKANIKRVVVVSSASAVVANTTWPRGKVKDETCWSDREYCRKNKKWYFLSKTEAELEAVKYGEKNGLDVVTVCPTWVYGPVLQPGLNASSLHLLKLLRDEEDAEENWERMIVDVRDLAGALTLLYEYPGAHGRYICTSHVILVKDLVEKLGSMYPDYKYSKNFKEVEQRERLSSQKLQKLGWTYRPLEETLADSVESYKQGGHMEKRIAALSSL